MKARIITACVAIPIIIVCFFFLPDLVVTLLFCLLSGIMAWEMLGATGAMRGHPLLNISCVFAAVLTYFYCYFNLLAIFITIFLYSAVGFYCLVKNFESKARQSGKVVDFGHVTEGFFAVIILPLLFTSIARILYMRPEGFSATQTFGRYFVLMPFVAVWLCDTLAMFGGMLLGKHKLAPNVSPKKTVEGSLVGVAGSVLGMFGYVFVLRNFCNIDVGYAIFVPLGLIAGVLGQIGDLFFSVIKRGFEIKDFGNLLPGHGGVLDRFDSIFLVAPLFELVLIALFMR